MNNDFRGFCAQKKFGKCCPMPLQELWQEKTPAVDATTWARLCNLCAELVVSRVCLSAPTFLLRETLGGVCTRSFRINFLCISPGFWIPFLGIKFGLLHLLCEVWNAWSDTPTFLRVHRRCLIKCRNSVTFSMGVRLCRGVRRPERDVDHFHVVPRLRMRGVLLSWQFGIRIPTGDGDFCVLEKSRLTLEPRQSPIQWAPGTFCPGSKAAVAWIWPLISIW